MFATVVLILVAIYGGLIALVYLNQHRLIYAPPVTRSDVPAGFERVTYATPDRLELTSGYRPAREGMPTVLFFHGNASSWQASAMVTDELAAQGYGVLAAEYRGYSGNPGTPSEDGLYQDARGAWQYLREEQGLAESDIVLVGNSIGAGVAVQLATEVRARALVLISPFDSLEETASRKLRWLPVRMLLTDRYANDEKLPEIGEPILILHGEADSLIALEQAQSLASVRDDTVIETYPGWGHDLVVHEPVQERIAAFLNEPAE
ncbi:alpha/beta hydrolase [Aurantiacibacter sediminis]|uniref:Alpha/beta fold hydrolase n=1 Tax=Aurantiacibacter sediminis TaxID=2793064 RepID=A0ABS0N042_9SPHN|nr:alpha/beta fold hydrolase [Aurantiacibacter sediminis]MBH5321303.1 alpha/beta fold hydrolase [Aurantiacibacter sediminis]